MSKIIIIETRDGAASAHNAFDARPIPAGPVLRIPAGDLRARIPARFAPAYLLTA